MAKIWSEETITYYEMALYFLKDFLLLLNKQLAVITCCLTNFYVKSNIYLSSCDLWAKLR